MKKELLAALLAGTLLAPATIFADPKPIQEVPNTEVSVPLTGIIHDIDAKNRRMSLREDTGKTVSVPLDNSVMIMRDGEQVSGAQLNEGDRVIINTRG
jgi:hypothetical protein